MFSICADIYLMSEATKNYWNNNENACNVTYRWFNISKSSLNSICILSAFMHSGEKYLYVKQKSFKFSGSGLSVSFERIYHPGHRT